MIDVVEHNRKAWNAESTSGESEWSVPVDAQTIALARAGEWSVILTPTLPVPQRWFGAIEGKAVLGLAAGGGQQVPVLAAAGAVVTSFDNAEEQLAKDMAVAAREDLQIAQQRGDMADLSCFADASFDLIFHPVSNMCVADVNVVWAECFRVLRPNGRLLAGFMNPDFYLFDHNAIEAGAPPEVKYRLPYSELTSATPEELREIQVEQRVLEFSHTMDAQIGGQTAAGFVIADFFEDKWSSAATALSDYMPISFATCAVKPANPLLG